MIWIAIFSCVGLFFIGAVAIIWGNQGDGYHHNPRDAEETGNVIAFMCLVAIITIIAGSIFG